MCESVGRVTRQALKRDAGSHEGEEDDVGESVVERGRGVEAGLSAPNRVEKCTEYADQDRTECDKTQKRRGEAEERQRRRGREA